MIGLNIFKKIWLYRAKKQIIKKYNHYDCNRTLNLFMKSYREYENAIFGIHTNLVQILRDIDFDGIESEWYEYRLQKLNTNLDNVKGMFVSLYGCHEKITGL